MSIALEPVPQKPIIFFDGFCILCNGLVDFAWKRDKARLFLFSALQGETARRLLTHGPCSGSHDSVVYFDQGKCWVRSEAVIRICLRLGGVYKLSILLKVIPRPLRDFVYDWIARHRYTWFGKRDTCRLPGPEDKGRMLD